MEKQPYNRLSEAVAKHYVAFSRTFHPQLAEIVIALDDLHRQNIVYRDLKMENILLTNSGHIILIDLGMSRVLEPGQRSTSYVGTPQYMVSLSESFSQVTGDHQSARPRQGHRLLVAGHSRLPDVGGRGSLQRLHGGGEVPLSLPHSPSSPASRASQSFSRPCFRCRRAASSAPSSRRPSLPLFFTPRTPISVSATTVSRKCAPTPSSAESTGTMCGAAKPRSH